MNTDNEEVLENEEIIEEESEEASEEQSEDASEEQSEEESEEVSEEQSEETQTILYELTDYTSHFEALESLGYIEIVFLGTFLIYFVLVLVYKFIKSFF